jgi:hypothetical protein
LLPGIFKIYEFNNDRWILQTSPLSKRTKKL